MDRATKIVATIGPSSSSESILIELIRAGMNVARLNFSHGTHDSHKTTINLIRKLSDTMGIPVAILQDLQGPKIRIGDFKENAQLLPGETFILTTQNILGNTQIASVDFLDLPDCVSPGGRILLDDGTIELKIVSIAGNQINTEIIVGGLLKPHKGVNLPGANIRIPSLTEKDEVDLKFGLANGVDAVALSFVQSAEDLEYCRQKIFELNPELSHLPIIAKLERPEALDNLDQIVSASDGVMVARGDLGVEMSPEKVPIAQKTIIECANRHGRLVITATQMLDSMINSPRPTRAEASDVANAILDGTDAVMLSGETAAGKFPLKSVQMMDAISRQAEAHIEQWGRMYVEPQAESITGDTYYIAQAARTLARDRNVAAIAVFTHSGLTARTMAKMRPSVPILAFTSVVEVYNRLPMYWGVIPFLTEHASSLEVMLECVNQTLIGSSLYRPGQQVVLICGYPLNSGAPANLALLHTLGNN